MYWIQRSCFGFLIESMSWPRAFSNSMFISWKRVFSSTTLFKEICWWFSTQDLTHILRQITQKKPEGVPGQGLVLNVWVHFYMNTFSIFFMICWILETNSMIKLEIRCIIERLHMIFPITNDGLHQWTTSMKGVARIPETGKTSSKFNWKKKMSFN